MTFTVSAEQWATAHKYLDNAANGTKLAYTLDNGVIRDRFISVPKDYQTTQSFIKINGKIFALAKGKSDDALLGRGSGDTKVKCAKTEDDKYYAVKITSNNLSSAKEQTILNDLQQLHGEADRFISKHLPPKRYLAINYLGEDLTKFMLKHHADLSIEQRLDFAIKVCWQVHNLHAGLSSKSHTPYAHMDLKHNNVAIDEHHNIQLIDFGHAKRSPKSNGISLTCAYSYVARRDPKSKLSKEQFDIFALKRILFMPAFIFYKGYIAKPDDDQYIESIFTADALNELGLFSYLDTNQQGDDIYYRDTITAASLCALFINARLKLPVEKELIAHNTVAATAMASLYFAGKIDQIETTLANPTLTKLTAALSSTKMMDQHEIYKNDPALLTALTQSKSVDAACALIYLKANGLEEHYQSALASADLAIIIKELTQAGLSKHIPTVITDKSGDYIQALTVIRLSKNKAYYARIFENDKLLDAFSHSASRKRAILIQLLRVKNIRDEDLIAVYKSADLTEAIAILKNGSSSYTKFCTEENIRAIIDSPERTKAILSLHREHSYSNTSTLVAATRTIDNCLAINQLTPQQLARLVPLRLVQQPELAVVINLLAARQMQPLIEFILKNHYDYSPLVLRLNANQSLWQGFEALYQAGHLQNITTDLTVAPDELFLAANLLVTKSLNKYLPILMAHPGTAFNFHALLIHMNIPQNIHNLNTLLNHMIQIAEKLPISEVLSLITTMFDKNQIQQLHQSRYHWHRLKSILPNENDRNSLLKLAISETEFESKMQLRNIKAEIKATTWKYKHLEVPVTLKVSGSYIDVPYPIYQQLAIIRKVTERSMPPSAALAKIKENCAAAHQNKLTNTSKLKLLFFKPTPTDKFMADFADEREFSKRFIKKG